MDQVRCIYSDRCWLNGKLQPATICFEKGVITKIIHQKLVDADDVGNSILMPGVIDVHVHINEPGRTAWEGFDTATQAAAAGGITTVIDMPLNSSPVTTNLKAFHEKLDASKNKMNVNVGFYAGLVPGNKDELPALIEAGVLGVKCFLTHSGIDEFPNVGKKELNEAMPLIAPFQIPLLAHCELHETPIENEWTANPTSYHQYLESRPRKWENDAINLMIDLCRRHGCQTHIVHVSSSDALSSISMAKNEGLNLTAETCAHYLYFNAENIPDKNSLFKCAPPIREKANNDLLKLALSAGTIDFITTDHSPAPPELKEVESGNLQKAWGGIAGMQFLLPGSWTALRNNIAIEEFIPLLTEKPAQFLKIGHRKGRIAVGLDADLVVWNPESSGIVLGKDILHRHKISPYIGEELFGTVLQTYVNGELVFKNNRIIHLNKGKWLLRK